MPARFDTNRLGGADSRNVLQIVNRWEAVGPFTHGQNLVNIRHPYTFIRIDVEMMNWPTDRKNKNGRDNNCDDRREPIFSISHKLVAWSVAIDRTPRLKTLTSHPKS
jgi:hypothetical protein